MRFAYADPPYPGESARLYGSHPDFAGEVDHGRLITQLESDYDAWALSTSVKALQSVLALCPAVRVLIWHKTPGTPFGDKFIWSWEPLLIRGGRRPRGYTRDLLTAMATGMTYSARRTPDEHVTGAKPERFSRWMFECLGAQPDAEFCDLFPGSGAVGMAWDRWRAQGSFEFEVA